MPKLPVGSSLTAPETLLLEEMNKLRSFHPWVVCLEFTDSDLIAEGLQYLVANTEDIEWDSKTWSPFPFKIDRIPSTSTGAFPVTKLSIFNTLEIVKLLEDYNGFVGKSVSIYFLNTLPDVLTNYTTTTYPYKYNFKVRAASVSQYITLELGSPNYLLSKIPARSYIRDYCSFLYLGEYCWMKDFEDLMDIPDLDAEIYTECNKNYEECKLYFNNVCTQIDAGTLSGTKPNCIAFGGYPTIARGDLNYL